jgi:hypothetical protein
MVIRNAFSAKAALAMAIAAVAALLALPAQASTYFDFSYSGAGVSGSGVFTAAGDAGNYSLTDVTGIANSLNITGFSSWANSDNMLLVPSTPSVDEGGISITTSSDTWNIYSFNGNYYITSINFFGDTNGVGVVGGTFGTELTSLSFSPTVSPSDPPPPSDPPSATPLPSTWTMLMAGCFGFGFLIYRGSKKGSAAAMSPGCTA